MVLTRCYRYFVVDSTEALAKFGADAWDRVVCVMTTGQAWQFRPYKWSEPKTLFHHGTWQCPIFLEEIAHVGRMVGSEGHIRIVGERPTQPQNQGLECHRT